jgi:hypothetical protein
MNGPLAILHYAGPVPAESRSLVYKCWRAIVWLITATIFVVIVTVRAALLLSGYVCVFTGLILLTLGGKRGAAKKLLEWRERAIDHLRLWRDDILRPIRQRRLARAARSMPLS